MDWGNAIVRSKVTDNSGTVTSMVMELNLEGDFKKTTKKITWLAQPTTAHPLLNATLIDYDYLITKKKLEEDDLKDFVTPVTEFREDALTDANVRELKRGDIVQFERRGYYIFDGINGGGSADEHSQTWEFILIPDGRAAGLASKAATAAATTAAAKINDKDDKVAAAAGGVDMYGVTPADTKMYKVDMVVGTEAPDVENATKMYRIESVYKV
jgi:glutamyl-tRNA synthetase